MLIHAAVLTIWVALFLLAFGHGGVFAWSIGLAYLAYDVALQAFTAWHIHRLTATSDAPDHASIRLRLAALVAAKNEAPVLPATLGALLDQTDPPDEIIIADDGSTDATADALHRFGLTEPDMGCTASVDIGSTSIVWLRLPHGGKARALNSAIVETGADVVVTVDGDTLLERRSD